MPQKESEYCISCGEATGKAGKGEDSLYSLDNAGPYCDACFPDDEGRAAQARREGDGHHA